MSETNEEKKPRRRPKKAKGHAGHHGGAWKVAYADFVTAMMALFLVLWLVSQADSKLKESIANYFRSPGVFDSVKGGIIAQGKKVSKQPAVIVAKDDEETLFNVAEELSKKFQNKPEFSKYKDQVKIEVTEEGLKIQLLDKAERVSFPSGSAELTAEARLILTEIAAGICELPNKINIGGHTDSRVFSSPNGYTNWELSTDRANAARRVLESVCVRTEQINKIIGYADTEPLVEDDPFAPANRRISITVLRQALVAPVAPREAAPQNDGKQPAVEKPPAAAEKEKPQPSAKKTVTLDELLPPPADAAEKPELSDEIKTNKNKLLNEGAVPVGKSDKLPEKPKTDR
jgi:chemotaxis protein MotB